ncbi:MAG: hypothetical protein ACKOXP_03445 [Flavobacteriales bacterium]
MKKLFLICLLYASTAQAQWKFPAFTSIGDTSFYRIDVDYELALAGFKDVLTYNYFTFDKKELTEKSRILYYMFYVEENDPNHVQFFYLIKTRRGYESWFETRVNQDWTIVNDGLTMYYTKEVVKP